MDTFNNVDIGRVRVKGVRVLIDINGFSLKVNLFTFIMKNNVFCFGYVQCHFV
jgi:hypothetical protein